MAEKPQLAMSPHLQLEAGYTQAFAYDSNGNVIYHGWAVPVTANKSNAVWRICRYTYDASNRVTDIDWADGDEQFNNVWNSRESITYAAPTPESAGGENEPMGPPPFLWITYP